jgi:wyosine [tRNA(Phe)-imidazoG37] synthetase (radical SAM superfamily)
MNTHDADQSEPDAPVTRDHRRQWRDCLYVYPVISRRSKGLSIGVNLNPDKRCNLGCIYCQINRRIRRDLDRVDLDVLREELTLALREALTGRLWDEPRFASTPAELRRVNDIAFSGDGEPTMLANFDWAVQVAAEVKDGFKDAGEVKLVVITNATLLDAPQVARALPVLDDHAGELWAKLDAGTEAFFRRVNRPADEAITLQKVVEGIAAVAAERPVVIQSLFFRLRGAPPGDDELAAYCERLKDIVSAGGQIRLVQVHTIARPPAEANVSGLSDDELDAIARAIRSAVPDTPVETYPGTDVPPQTPDNG